MNIKDMSNKVKGVFGNKKNNIIMGVGVGTSVAGVAVLAAVPAGAALTTPMTMAAAGQSVVVPIATSVGTMALVGKILVVGGVCAFGYGLYCGIKQGWDAEAAKAQ